MKPMAKGVWSPFPLQTIPHTLTPALSVARCFNPIRTDASMHSHMRLQMHTHSCKRNNEEKGNARICCSFRCFASPGHEEARQRKSLWHIREFSCSSLFLSHFDMNFTHSFITYTLAYTVIYPYILSVLTHTLPHSLIHPLIFTHTFIHTPTQELTHSLSFAHTYAHIHKHIAIHKYALTHSLPFAHTFIHSFIHLALIYKDALTRFLLYVLICTNIYSHTTIPIHKLLHHTSTSTSAYTHSFPPRHVHTYSTTHAITISHEHNFTRACPSHKHSQTRRKQTSQNPKITHAVKMSHLTHCHTCMPSPDIQRLAESKERPKQPQQRR